MAEKKTLQLKQKEKQKLTIRSISNLSISGELLHDYKETSLSTRIKARKYQKDV